MYISYLPQTACNDELEWFKSVKETQASVEITSIGQMNSVLKYGCYLIGSSTPRICQSPHEVIRLELQEREQRLIKKRYNLEELRDLESKLVLITGSKAENRALVDLFLDVRRIYQLFLYPIVKIVESKIELFVLEILNLSLCFPLHCDILLFVFLLKYMMKWYISLKFFLKLCF